MAPSWHGTSDVAILYFGFWPVFMSRVNNTSTLHRTYCHVVFLVPYVVPAQLQSAPVDEAWVEVVGQRERVGHEGTHLQLYDTPSRMHSIIDVCTVNSKLYPSDLPVEATLDVSYLGSWNVTVPWCIFSSSLAPGHRLAYCGCQTTFFSRMVLGRPRPIVALCRSQADKNVPSTSHTRNSKSNYTGGCGELEISCRLLQTVRILSGAFA